MDHRPASTSAINAAPEVHIALCADQNAEVGLHVTLHSTLTHLDPSSMAFVHLFLGNFDRRRIKLLNLTLEAFARRCQLKIYDLHDIDLGKGSGLHGNKMPYALLHFPRIVHAMRVLCLDADLLVTTDVAEIYRWDLGSNYIAAVSLGTVEQCWNKEAEFLSRVGVSREAPYFNTGVVLVDTIGWNRKDLTRVCLEFAAAHSSELRTADQTVLNAVVHGNVSILPPNYNIHCYPTAEPPDVSSPGVYHFVGSPKPWDLGGKYLHRSHPVFQRFLSMTSCETRPPYQYLSPRRLLRILSLSRSYYKATKGWLFPN
jgi:lipopolysaccharide biosynthesis glycosyltransferase